MSQTFGQYIRALRKERGITQKSLSQAIGFKSIAHLSDIENGKRNPSKETFKKFAKALGVTVRDLESRDARGPIEAAKALFASKPEMVGAFLTILEAAKKMNAEELLARLTLSGFNPPALQSPPTAYPLVRVIPPAPEKYETPKAQLKPVPEEKSTHQPTLF